MASQQISKAAVAPGEVAQARVAFPGAHGLRAAQVRAKLPNGQAAVEYVRTHPVDLMVVDLRMPGPSGLELVKRLKQLDENTRIVVLTGYASVATMSIAAVMMEPIQGEGGYVDPPSEFLQQVAAAKKAGALLIVDDSDWAQVSRALDDYLAEQPRARRLLTIEGKDAGFPHWWEGMQVLVWDD